MSLRDEMDENEWDYINLISEIRNSEELLSFRSFRKYRFLIFYYRRNIRELILNSNAFFTVPDIMEYETSFERWQLQHQILINLHNTLYSSQSYCEVLNKKKVDYRISEDIGKKLHGLFNNEIHLFIRLLRNYGTHIDQFDLISTLSHIRNGKEVSEGKKKIAKKNIESFIEKLSDREKNKFKKGIEFFNNQPLEIDIIPILINYRAMLNDLHRWFTLTYFSEYREDFIYLIKKMKSLREIAQKANSTTGRSFRTDIPLGYSQCRYIEMLLTVSENHKLEKKLYNS